VRDVRGNRHLGVNRCMVHMGGHALCGMSGGLTPGCEQVYWEGCIVVGGLIDAAKKQSQRFSSTRSALIIRLGYLITENVVFPAHRLCGEAA
jgi:hypothetical protein